MAPGMQLISYPETNKMDNSHLHAKRFYLRNSIALFYLLSLGYFSGNFSPDFVHASEPAPSREESQFKIYIAGKEVGKEKFTILTSADSVNSSSILEFQEPGNNGRKVKIETQLTANSRFLPRSYSLKTDVDGHKGLMVGTFTPGQVMFEIKGDGISRKSGLLIGDQCQILDSNIFHHFTYIARAFDFEQKKSQSFEVVVPQELDDGVLKVSNVGKEFIFLRGKGKDLIHLRGDSGQLLIDLWIDSRRILHKIAIPAKQIEVIRMD
jgi:hypothetical protein